MVDAKPVNTVLATHFRLLVALSLQIYEEREYIPYIPCASAVGSLMYVMVCTHPNISHAISVVS